MPTSAGLYNEKQPLHLSKVSDLTESTARHLLESVRWPDGPVCMKCGEIDNAARIKPRTNSKHPGRNGLWQCRGCRAQFTVTVGTVFEDSHIPLHRWLLVAYLMCASKRA